MIRVMIVDDHEFVRLGIRSYLQTEPDIDVVAEAGDGAEAVELANSLRPDVVLMDVLMPGMAGVEATKEMVSRGIAGQIVMLTSSLDDERMVQALRAGALSYLLKTSTAASVADAVRKAFEAKPVLDPAVQRKILDSLKGQDDKPGSDLTERERQVLKGIAQGKNNQEIADHLHIGLKTVKTHVSNILSKLGVMDRTQAAIYAIRHHLD